MDYSRLSRVSRAKNANSISWYKYNYLKEQETLNSFQEKNEKKYNDKKKSFDEVIKDYRQDKNNKRNFSSENEEEKKEILRDIMDNCDICNCTLSEIRQAVISLYENNFLNDEEKSNLDEIISIKEEEILDECIEAGNSALDFSILKNRRFNITEYIKEKAEGLIRIKLFLKGNQWQELIKKLDKFSKNNLSSGGMEIYNYKAFMLKK